MTQIWANLILINEGILRVSKFILFWLVVLQCIGICVWSRNRVQELLFNFCSFYWYAILQISFFWTKIISVGLILCHIQKFSWKATFLKGLLYLFRVLIKEVCLSGVTQLHGCTITWQTHPIGLWPSICCKPPCLPLAGSPGG